MAKTIWKSLPPTDPIFTKGPTTFTPVPRPVVPPTTTPAPKVTQPPRRRR
jgi:hypothetical protein